MRRLAALVGRLVGDEVDDELVAIIPLRRRRAGDVERRGRDRVAARGVFGHGLQQVEAGRAGGDLRGLRTIGDHPLVLALVLHQTLRGERGLGDALEAGLVAVFVRVACALDARVLPIDAREAQRGGDRLGLRRTVVAHGDDGDRELVALAHDLGQLADAEVEVGRVQREGRGLGDGLLVEVGDLAEQASCARLGRFRIPRHLERDGGGAVVGEVEFALIGEVRDAVEFAGQAVVVDGVAEVEVVESCGGETGVVRFDGPGELLLRERFAHVVFRAQRHLDGLLAGEGLRPADADLKSVRRVFLHLKVMLDARALVLLAAHLEREVILAEHAFRERDVFVHGAERGDGDLLAEELALARIHGGEHGLRARGDLRMVASAVADDAFEVDDFAGLINRALGEEECLPPVAAAGPVAFVVLEIEARDFEAPKRDAVVVVLERDEIEIVAALGEQPAGFADGRELRGPGLVGHGFAKRQLLIAQQRELHAAELPAAREREGVRECLLGGVFPDHPEIGDLHDGLHAGALAGRGGLAGLLGGHKHDAGFSCAEDLVPAQRDLAVHVGEVGAGELLRVEDAPGDLVGIELAIRFVILRVRRIEVFVVGRERAGERVGLEEFRRHADARDVDGEEVKLALSGAELVLGEALEAQARRDGLKGEALAERLRQRERFARGKTGIDGDFVFLIEDEIAAERDGAVVHRSLEIRRLGRHMDPAQHTVGGDFRRELLREGDDHPAAIDAAVRGVRFVDGERLHVPDCDFEIVHGAQARVARRHAGFGEEPPVPADGQRLHRGDVELVLPRHVGIGADARRGEDIALGEARGPCEQRAILAALAREEMLAHFERVGLHDAGGDFLSTARDEFEEARGVRGADIGVEEEVESWLGAGVLLVQVAVHRVAFHFECGRLDHLIERGIELRTRGVFQPGAERELEGGAERERLGGREDSTARAEPDEAAFHGRCDDERRRIGGFAERIGAGDGLREADLEGGGRLELARAEHELGGGLFRTGGADGEGGEDGETEV